MSKDYSPEALATLRETLEELAADRDRLFDYLRILFARGATAWTAEPPDELWLDEVVAGPDRLGNLDGDDLRRLSTNAAALLMLSDEIIEVLPPAWADLLDRAADRFLAANPLEAPDRDEFDHRAWGPAATAEAPDRDLVAALGPAGGGAVADRLSQMVGRRALLLRRRIPLLPVGDHPPDPAGLTIELLAYDQFSEKVPGFWAVALVDGNSVRTDPDLEVELVLGDDRRFGPTAGPGPILKLPWSEPALLLVDRQMNGASVRVKAQMPGKTVARWEGSIEIPTRVELDDPADAWTELRYGRDVYLIYRKIRYYGPEKLAKATELAHEALTQILRRRLIEGGEPKSLIHFSNKLIRSAVNKHRSELRKALGSGPSTRPLEAIDPENPDAPSPANLVGVRDLYDAVQPCLSEFSAVERRIILAHAREGLDFREIAREVGLSPAATRSRYYRAMGDLLACLTARGLDLDPWK